MKKPTPVRLTRIRSNHRILRTDFVDGFTLTFPPKVGSCFEMWGPGLSDPRLTRMVNTSAIRSVKKIRKGAYEVLTDNSLYRIEAFKDGDIEARPNPFDPHICMVVSPEEDAEK